MGHGGVALQPKSHGEACSELKETVGIGQEVKESDTARLPYLQAVAKEMR